MRIAFVDFIYGYDAARPDEDKPLGGTTSSICFLARAMVAAGHSCTFYNRISAPAPTLGVLSFPVQSLAGAVLDERFDAYVFCGRWTQQAVEFIRARTNAPLICWMHECLFADPLTPALEAFDGVVFVSDWHRRANKGFIRPHWVCSVIRNAMNPRILPWALDGGGILSHKRMPFVLTYSGSFARGAFHVPAILDIIRRKRSDFIVEMFCNLDPSRDRERDAAYIAWLRTLPNMGHVGFVGQNEYLEKMRTASIMLMPNPYPETSCISMIEGLALGLDVVSTDRAALPETASGFARMVRVECPDDPVRFDIPVDLDLFAAKVLDAMAEREENPEGVEARLRKQTGFFRANYRWEGRVESWVSFVDQVSHKPSHQAYK